MEREFPAHGCGGCHSRQRFWKGSLGSAQLPREFDLQLFLAEAGPLGTIQRHHGLPMEGIPEHHCQAVTLIIIIMDEALGLGPEDPLIVGGQAKGHTSRWLR
jgi:hypothetical protein